MSARLAALALAAVLVTAGCSGTPDDEVASVQSPSQRGETGPTLPAVEPGVSFVSPQDGDSVTSPVAVEMAAEGLTIEAAGEVHDGAGHFHLIVDADCVEPGTTIPAADGVTYFHFGDGSSTAELDLEPGPHTVCLQLGDGVHTATSYTDTISITVPG